MFALSDLQWERIGEHFFEETIPDGRPGRKPVPALRALEGALRILNIGAQWHMLPRWYRNYKTMQRRFQNWCREEALCSVLRDLAKTLRDEGSLAETESFSDARCAKANGGGDGIGPAKRGKGVKMVGIENRHGCSLAVGTYAAKHHEVTRAVLTSDSYMIEGRPEKLIGDCADDCDRLDEELREDGIDVVAPHRSNGKKRRTQDDRLLRRFARR